MNWISQSLLATALLVFPWLMVGFFGRNYAIKPEVFLVWYFLGAMVVFTGAGKSSTFSIPLGVIGAIFIIGLTMGGFANILLFRAVAGAPNPGLAVAISGLASVGVYLVSIPLGKWAPRYFDATKFDPWFFLGVLLAIAGVAIVAIRQGVKA